MGTDLITVESGKDGKWVAWATGAMGRRCVASAENGDRARRWCVRMLVDQQAEAYHREQAMTAQSLIQSGEQQI